LEDPQTGLPSRVQAERVLAAAIREGKHIFVAPFVLERFRFLVQRFGLRLAEQAIQIYGVFLAHGLAPGYDLYRWSGPALVVLVEREGAVTHVRREIAHLGSMRMERVFEMRARSALLFISSGWTVFEVAQQDSLETVSRRIDDYVSAQQQQWNG
jgi:GGDEF domain-containing protein